MSLAQSNMRCEVCGAPATVQDLGSFLDPPGTEHWYCDEHGKPEGLTTVDAREAGARVPDDAIHLWFSLSYANYLVIPRSVLQSMPIEWQRRFVGCLREIHETFELEWPDYDVRALKRQPEHVSEQTCLTCDGEGVLEDGDTEKPCDECDGNGFIEEDRWETPEEVGIIRDPIPHYNRGRTRLEPKVP